MGWNALLGAIRRDLELSPGLRELAMCVVAVLNGAEYEWSQHAPLFVQAGGGPMHSSPRCATRLDPRCGPTASSTTPERAALALIVEMTRSG